MIGASDLTTFIKAGYVMLQKKTPTFPLIGSFDITSKCTLKCKHCYWWEQEHSTELSETDYLTKIKEIKKIYPTLVYGVWLGGEPLLRKELLEKCMKSFCFNEVITNGTLPLPNWKSVRFTISIDGTKKYHELQRGKSWYERIKNNIDRPDLNVNINCVLTRINQECLEDFVEEWSKTNIKSIGFSFYTPILGKDNEAIWLTFEERDKVLTRLKLLKQKYPKLIGTPDKLLENFRSDVCRKVTEKCRRDYAPFISMCFDAMMKRKFPCVIGEKADCEKCGCSAAVIGESIRQGDYHFMTQHLKNKVPFV